MMYTKGTMITTSNIVTDSVNEAGERITTIRATFPRFFLAELNVHGLISKNSSSMRAIPPEKLIEQVVNNPFVPSFNQRVTGMGVGEPLDVSTDAYCRAQWLRVRNQATSTAQNLIVSGADKSRINQILSPFAYQTAILTATTWRNMLALRCPDGNEPDINFSAQLEFQELALSIRNNLLQSTPTPLQNGQWHLPYVTDQEQQDLTEQEAILVSGGRLARVSYLRDEEPETLEQTITRATKLKENWHMSVFEHQGQASPGIISGNFTGWVQARKTFVSENDASITRTNDWISKIN
jgi:hypothetical protein